MNLLAAIIIGTIVGAIGAVVSQRMEWVITYILAGISGAITIGTLWVIANRADLLTFIFSWPALFWSAFGAIAAVALATAVQFVPRHQ